MNDKFKFSDEKLILSDLKGPSWSPEKKIKIFKPIVSQDKIDDKQNEELKLDSITSLNAWLNSETSNSGILILSIMFIFKKFF